MGLMAGKICVVTGGAGSVGKASAALLLKEGANVVLVDRDAADLARAKQYLDSDRVLAQVADVTQSDQTKKYIDSAVAAWGHIDVLFANAGVSGTNAPITGYPEEIFDDVAEGSELGFSFEKGEIIYNGKTFKFNRFPEHILRIIEHGGLINYINSI